MRLGVAITHSILSLHGGAPVVALRNIDHGRCHRRSQIDSPLGHLFRRLMANELLSESGGRPYRSKKKRPCDLCRSRKTQCRILDGDATCELCKRLARDCTFVLQPLRKEPRQQLGSEIAADQQADRRQYEFEDNPEAPPLLPVPRPDDDDSSMALNATPIWLALEQGGRAPVTTPGSASHLLPMDWSSFDFPISTLSKINQVELSGTNHAKDPSLGSGHASYEQPQTRDGTTAANTAHQIDTVTPLHSADSMDDSHGNEAGQIPSSGPSPSRFMQGLLDSRQQSVQNFDWPTEFSLDSKEGYSNQLIGLSGESDPFLLQYYLYNVYDTYPMFRLDFRKIMGNESVQPVMVDELQAPVGNIPIQFVMSDESIYEDDLRIAETAPPGRTPEACDATRLENLVPADVGVRLFGL